MSVDSPNSLLSVPDGPLQIAEVTLAAKAGFSQPLSFSLVIPTYNESENIPRLVEILSQLLDESIPGEYELLVVDDDSPDQTWAIAQSLMSDYPQLRVMRRQHERGLSSAAIRGWQASRGQVLGLIDGDLQHPPQVLLQLLRAIEQGADLAVASRHIEGGGVSSWSVIRRFLSRGAQLMGLILLPGVLGRVSDPMSGYFLVRRRSLVGRRLYPQGYKILIEVLARGAVSQVTEVAYVFQERRAGESKVTWKQYVDYLHHLLKLRLSLWPVGRFLRFGVVGLSGVFVDLGLFYLLRSQDVLGLTRSAIVSGEVAILNNFLWNDLWTFGDIARHQGKWRQRAKRLLKFNFICLTGLVLNVLLLNLLFNLFHLNQYVAKLLAIAAVTLWNFWFNLKFSWRVTEVK
jgi:dolichol-phosphate mannosyltransferase